jgi:hypothetical protein
MTWLIIPVGEYKHIIPDDESHLIDGCSCNPDVDKDFMVISHNSYDGREAFETGERKPS